jgi:hypothetical protein
VTHLYCQNTCEGHAGDLASLATPPRVPGLKTRRGEITSFLDHRDRICKIRVYVVPISRLEEISAAMQEPFLQLIHLQLGGHYRLETMANVPDSLLCWPICTASDNLLVGPHLIPGITKSVFIRYSPRRSTPLSRVYLT